MKPSSSLAILFFLLVALWSNLPLFVAEDEAILDLDGNEVVPSSKYYILPVIPLFGGGLNITTVGDETCPNVVYVAFSSFDYGAPLAFSTSDASDTITTSSNVSISFTNAPSCSGSASWRVDYDSATGTEFITTSNATSSYSFQLVSTNSYGAYTITYCYSTGSCSKYVGIDTTYRLRRLALDATTTGFVFKKVDDELALPN